MIELEATLAFGFKMRTVRGSESSTDLEVAGVPGGAGEGGGDGCCGSTIRWRSWVSGVMVLRPVVQPTFYSRDVRGYVCVRKFCRAPSWRTAVALRTPQLRRQPRAIRAAPPAAGRHARAVSAKRLFVCVERFIILRYA